LANASGKFAPAKANRRLTPAGELDATCGFAPTFQTEGIRDLVGNGSRASQSFDMEFAFDMELARKRQNTIGENHGRKD
jgi:hypothetical protein